MKYKSEIYEVIHQDAAANFEVGAISKAEMQDFNKMCLVEEPETSYETEKSRKTDYAVAVKQRIANTMGYGLSHRFFIAE